MSQTFSIDAYINLDSGPLNKRQLEVWETIKLGKFTMSGLMKSMAGLNMHFLGPDSQSPISLLMKSDKNLTQLSKLFRAMLDQGANPFQLDCPFQKENSMLTAGTLATVLRNHEMETGIKTRGQNGCNAYHCWLYSKPRQPEYHLMMLTEKKQTDPVLSGWLSERTLVDGDTPIHRMWQAAINNPPTHSPSIARTDPYGDPSYILWSVASTLLEFGATFSIENATGKTAADLALFCVDSKKIRVPPHARKIVNQLRNIVSEHTSNMPAAPDILMGRKGPRL